ncbi:hypothetical protein PG994_011341 [Apiospora phragmitis]|uniref:G-patch domain-containing protein n=1 Tax=Apiospora phragmitis TaxID=2905665 RepID=A0ABR1TUR7_9PEZI
MSSLRSEMLDHLLEKFEEKDKAILCKMIKASLDDDNEAALAHRVFKSVVAYVGAQSTISCLEATALESIQDTLASLAETANTASGTNTLKSEPSEAKTQGSQIAKEVQEEAVYTHFGGEKHPQSRVEAPRSTARDLSANLAKMQLDGQPASVHPEMPKSSPVNYGMKMMMKNGWKPGQGLGAKGDGITEPVLSPEQLVPDRKDYNPGVGSQQRMTIKDAAHARNPQGALGQVTNENKKLTTGSVKSDEKAETWEPLRSGSTPVSMQTEIPELVLQRLVKVVRCWDNGEKVLEAPMTL